MSPCMHPRWSSAPWLVNHLRVCRSTPTNVAVPGAAPPERSQQVSPVLPSGSHIGTLLEVGARGRRDEVC